MNAEKTTQIYGIKNCDTLKKALKWLVTENIEVTYHDYRKDGLDETLIKQFIAHLGWESLINKRGTTYRALSDADKNALDENRAIALMLAQPAIIKRPLLIHQNQYHLGFKPEQYQAIFSAKK